MKTQITGAILAASAISTLLVPAEAQVIYGQQQLGMPAYAPYLVNGMHGQGYRDRTLVQPAVIDGGISTAGFLNGTLTRPAILGGSPCGYGIGTEIDPLTNPVVHGQSVFPQVREYSAVLDPSVGFRHRLGDRGWLGDNIRDRRDRGFIRNDFRARADRGYGWLGEDFRGRNWLGDRFSETGWLGDNTAIDMAPPREVALSGIYVDAGSDGRACVNRTLTNAAVIGAPLGGTHVTNTLVHPAVLEAPILIPTGEPKVELNPLVRRQHYVDHDGTFRGRMRY
jgi:hypothetical protein